MICELAIAIYDMALCSAFMKSNDKRIRLFIKPWCGWCDEAMEWLDARSIKYEILDVTSDASARREMFELSNQSLAPTIDVDGEILADFDTDQLERFWNELGENEKLRKTG
jgi:glutaredoxin 3